MKFLIATIVLFNFVLLSQALLEDRWPTYLQKCEPNNPHFNDCVLKSAEVAFKNFAKGDPSLGLECICPARMKELQFGQNETWHINMTDVKIFGLDAMRFKSFNWDTENKRVDMQLQYCGSIVIKGNYVTTGRFLSLPSIGMGMMKLVFVGGLHGANLTYQMDYTTLNVLGSEYGQVMNAKCNLKSGFMIDFTNELISPKELLAHVDNVNKHPDEALKGINPVVEKLLCEQQSDIWRAIFDQFPLEIIAPKK